MKAQVMVEAQIGQFAFEKRELIGLIEQPDRLDYSFEMPVFPDKLESERVKRARPDLRCGGRHCVSDPSADFSRRLVRERQCQDAGRGNVHHVEQIFDARNKGASLAGAWTGLYEQRRAVVLCGLFLGIVQARPLAAVRLVFCGRAVRKKQ